MQKRRLGQTDLSIAPLVLGGNVFGWTADEKTSFDLLDRFVGAGLNAIDTADAYSRWVPGNKGGESETIIGKWMKSRGNRDKVVVITKVGSDMGQGRKDLSAAYIEKAIDASLKRLQTDVVDLYLSHWPDPATPYEETLGAYQKLLDKGKIRNVGASNLDAGQLRAALDVASLRGLPHYAVLQPEYNLYDRASFDGPLRDLCMAEDIGVITRAFAEIGFAAVLAAQKPLGEVPCHTIAGIAPGYWYTDGRTGLFPSGTMAAIARTCAGICGRDGQSGAGDDKRHRRWRRLRPARFAPLRLGHHSWYGRRAFGRRDGHYGHARLSAEAHTAPGGGIRSLHPLPRLQDSNGPASGSAYRRGGASHIPRRVSSGRRQPESLCGDCRRIRRHVVRR
ncbi:Uncharacterized 11.2 kDa protein in crtE 3'region (modular protein) [Mesorhizobium prunaredense]|uniref:Uncharacterized 11.2 kDa protein in crtE 3'region (Modular protein) n=2 Tax=Mesorhizobium TaxID=68287 RepID=A0A1R3V4H3_9HYPH|nr:Uncharacterized 11.2 kDa protein in crtE 3'region (modular protein) [Mesorhizobium prunaredense]